MYYICDIKNDKFGIKDTNDGVVEYFTLTELVDLMQAGVGIVGFNRSLVTSVCNYPYLVTYNEKTIKHLYAGDYIGEGRWDSIALLDYKDCYYRSVSFRNSLLRELGGDYRLFFLHTGICDANVVNKRDRMVNNYWTGGSLSIRGSKFVVNKGNECGRCERMLIIPYDFSDEQLYGFRPISITTYDSPSGVVEVIAKEGAGLPVQLANLAIDIKKAFVVSRHYSEESGMLYFVVAKVGSDGQYHFDERNSTLSALALADMLYRNPDSFFNVTVDDKGFTYSGLDGTIRFEFAKLIEIYDRTYTQEDKLRALKLKFTGEIASETTKNGVVLKFGYKGNDICLMDNSKYLIGSYHMDNIAIMERVVIPKSFIRGSVGSLDYVLGTIRQLVTHTEHFMELADLIVHCDDIRSVIDWMRSSPVCALCLAIELYNRKSNMTLKNYWSSYFEQYMRRQYGFKDAITQQTVEDAWQLLYIKTYNKFKILSQFNTMCSQSQGRMKKILFLDLADLRHEELLASQADEDYIMFGVYKVFRREFFTCYSFYSFLKIYGSYNPSDTTVRAKQKELKTILNKVDKEIKL